MGTIIGYIISIPHTMLGLVLALFYGVHDCRWQDGVIRMNAKRMIGNPSMQTHGFLVFVKMSDYAQWDANYGGPVWRHETLGHVRAQSFQWGPIYPIAYGVEWLIRFIFDWTDPDVFGPRWFRAYYSLSWERHARGFEDV